MGGMNDRVDDINYHRGPDAQSSSPREGAEKEADAAEAQVDSVLDKAEWKEVEENLKDNFASAELKGARITETGNGLKVTASIPGLGSTISAVKSSADGAWKMSFGGQTFEYVSEGWLEYDSAEENMVEDMALVQKGMQIAQDQLAKERDPSQPRIPIHPFGLDGYRMTFDTAIKPLGGDTKIQVGGNDWVEADDEKAFVGAMNTLYTQYVAHLEGKREEAEGPHWSPEQQENVAQIFHNLNTLLSAGVEEAVVEEYRAALTELTGQGPHTWDEIKSLGEEVEALLEGADLSPDPVSDAIDRAGAPRPAVQPRTAPAPTPEAPPAEPAPAPKPKPRVVSPQHQDADGGDGDKEDAPTPKESREAKTRKELDQLQRAYNKAHDSTENVTRMILSMEPGSTVDDIRDMNFYVSSSGIAILTFKLKGNDYGFSSGIAKSAVKRDFELDDGEYGRLIRQLFWQIESPGENNVGSAKANERLKKRMQKLNDRAERKLGKIKKKEGKMDRAKSRKKRNRRAGRLQEDVTELQDFAEEYEEEADRLDFNKEEARANAILDELDEVADNIEDQQ